MGSDPPIKQVNSLSFQAVAVIATTDIDGRVVSVLKQNFLIKKPDISNFLDQLSLVSNADEYYIFWGNFRVHHSKEVKQVAARNN